MALGSRGRSPSICRSSWKKPGDGTWLTQRVKCRIEQHGSTPCWRRAGRWRPIHRPSIPPMPPGRRFRPAWPTVIGRIDCQCVNGNAAEMRRFTMPSIPVQPVLPVAPWLGGKRNLARRIGEDREPLVSRFAAAGRRRRPRWFVAVQLEKVCGNVWRATPIRVFLSICDEKKPGLVSRFRAWPPVAHNLSTISPRIGVARGPFTLHHIW